MKPGERFISHGYHYEVNEHGAIEQLNPQPFKYDENYVQTYNSPDYLRESELLQSLRFAYCTLAHRNRINSILDIGYGAGQFMRYASKYVDHVHGADVTGVEIEGCEVFDDIPDGSYDVITFWDCLEHIPDLEFLRDLKCKTIVISLPYCHLFEEEKEWFDNQYPHRKPNEHIRHFHPGSLSRTMRHYGWNALIMPDFMEDVVRKSKHGLQNILTMSFKR